jgi:hypothetical protein
MRCSSMLSGEWLRRWPLADSNGQRAEARGFHRSRATSARADPGCQRGKWTSRRFPLADTQA